MDQNQHATPLSQRRIHHILHHPKTVRTMHKVSRMVVTVGCFMLVAVLFIAYFKYKKPVPVAPQVVNVSPTPLFTPVPTLARIAFTLEGPLTCNYSSPEASVSASILKKQLYVSFSEATASAQAVVSGDCAYIWRNQQLIGEKMCGMEKLMQTAELMSSMGLLNLETVLTALPIATESSLLSNPTFINNVVSTCKKEASDEAVFVVPQNIQFTEKEAPTPLQ